MTEDPPGMRRPQLLPIDNGPQGDDVVGLVLRLASGDHLVTCGLCAARFRVAAGGDPWVVLDGHHRQCMEPAPVVPLRPRP